MIKINLLAEGKRTAVRKTRSAVSLADREWGNLALVGGLLVGVLVGAAWWGLLWRAEQEARRQVEIKEAEVAQLQEALKQVEQFEKTQKDFENKIAVIKTLKANQTGPVRVMDAVSRAVPELLWLDRMEVTPNLIKLQGRAFNYAAISNFIEKLDAVPEFKEPQLGRAAESGQVNTFSITVGYSLDPPPPPATAGEEAAPGAAAGANPAPTTGARPAGPGR